jgi:hypothetical protein
MASVSISQATLITKQEQPQSPQQQQEELVATATIVNHNPNQLTLQPCCSTVSICSFTGAFIINIAFIALIYWATSLAWLAGLILCFGYTCLLFYLSFHLKKHYVNKIESIKLTSDILAMLGVFGLSVCGFILAVNISSCPISVEGSETDSLTAKTKAYVPKSIPMEIENWAKLDLYSGWNVKPTFAILNNGGLTGDICFSGNNGTSSANGVYCTNNGAPMKITSKVDYPMYFVSIQKYVCFTGIYYDKMNSNSNGKLSVICTNGVDIEPLATKILTNPRNLISHGGLLYLKSYTLGGTTTTMPSNGYIYTINITSKETTLLSTEKNGTKTLSPSSSTEKNGEKTLSPSSSNTLDKQLQCTSFTSLYILIFCSIVMLIMSFVLLIKIHVPSMIVPIFVGVTISVINLYYIIDPSAALLTDVLKWWSTIFSVIWLTFFIIIYLSKITILLNNQNELLTWAINTGGLVYFSAIHTLLGVPFYYDTLWRCK